MNRDQGDNARHDCQHRHRRPQDERQHNGDEYDCSRDAFEQGKVWTPLVALRYLHEFKIKTTEDAGDTEDFGFLCVLRVLCG